MSHRAFFQPFTLKSLTLANRFVMAPMTRGFSPEGVPTPEVAEYYARRAAGGVGLIVSEGTLIDRPAAGNNSRYPHFHGGDALAGWKRTIGAVHDAGGAMGPQLWHLGAQRPMENCAIPPEQFESPSGLLASGEPAGRAMTDADIADTIAAYASAAADAKRLGFDMLELHGAHAYLIDQFFWSATNRRTDSWGGDTIAERVRFGVEVVRAVRAAVGDDFVVALRLSQWKPGAYEFQTAKTPDELADWLLPLSDAGVDLFHLSQRRFWEPEFAGSDLNFAGWAKKITGKPTVTVGSVGLDGEFIGSFRGEGSAPAPIDALERRMERGDFDLVALGRVLLSDPNWVAKLRDGREAEFVGFDRSAMEQLV